MTMFNKDERSIIKNFTVKFLEEEQRLEDFFDHYFRRYWRVHHRISLVLKMEDKYRQQFIINCEKLKALKQYSNDDLNLYLSVMSILASKRIVAKNAQSLVPSPEQS